MAANAAREKVVRDGITPPGRLVLLMGDAAAEVGAICTVVRVG